MSNDNAKHPWAAVWALLLGFFMIMIDSTIVTIASPRILSDLNTDIVAVQWVQSAYLLALAVPMLLTGRLGDRFGPKNLTVIGLVLFTAASVWCGLSRDISSLIAARAVQGVGAACLSPQSMALITRIFPPQRRGAPLGLLGGVAGVAMLVGPLVGGLLVDSFGWRAVFFINVPLGLIAVPMTVVLVPRLPRLSLRPDFVGALLSAIGLLCVVWGLQEAERYDWGQIRGPLYVWGLIGFGLAAMVVFVWWEARNRRDPLVPIGMFRRRNFALGSAAILVVSFSMTIIPVPLMYYYQIGRGISPSQAAVILIPMAVVSGLLAPVIGRATTRIDPRRFAVAGLLIVSIATLGYFQLLSPTTPIGWFLVPSAVAGLGSACIWGPISIIASHDIEPQVAGRGSAIYNVMRQLGAVIGSAAMTSMMESRLTHELPGSTKAAPSLLDPNLGLLDWQLGPFATAMAESLLLPIGTLVVALLLAIAFAKRPVYGPPERGLERLRALLNDMQAPPRVFDPHQLGRARRPARISPKRGALPDGEA